MASHNLDPYQKPPDDLRRVFKRYQRVANRDLEQDPFVLDFKRGFDTSQGDPRLAVFDKTLSATYAARAEKAFESFQTCQEYREDVERPVSCYELTDVPGLYIIPNLFPGHVQIALLNRLIHRDLPNPAHQTNVHLHYDVPYPPDNQSFFTYNPSEAPVFEPLDPSVHKPLSISQFLDRKLRWVTLGGQYDWTKKEYPDGRPPDFPADIASLLQSLFPEMEAQAAICNFYSPGDTLSLHRDVSEEADRGLVSVSIGCDALFVLGLEGEGDSPSKYAVVRLRSGDTVYMTGRSRFAWHGVPQIIPDTCPRWLESWPSRDGIEDTDSVSSEYDKWRGWMKTKRINLNVRQMFD